MSYEQFRQLAQSSSWAYLGFFAFESPSWESAAGRFSVFTATTEAIQLLQQKHNQPHATPKSFVLYAPGRIFEQTVIQSIWKIKTCWIPVRSHCESVREDILLHLRQRHVNWCIASSSTVISTSSLIIHSLFQAIHFTCWLTEIWSYDKANPCQNNI